MEDALTSSFIAEEHHALMGVVLQNLRFVDNGLKEAFNGLLTGFKVSQVMFSLKEFLLYKCIASYTVAPETLTGLIKAGQRIISDINVRRVMRRRHLRQQPSTPRSWPS